MYLESGLRWEEGGERRDGLLERIVEHCPRRLQVRNKSFDVVN